MRGSCALPARPPAWGEPWKAWSWAQGGGDTSGAGGWMRERSPKAPPTHGCRGLSKELAQHRQGGCTPKARTHAWGGPMTPTPQWEPCRPPRLAATPLVVRAQGGPQSPPWPPRSAAGSLASVRPCCRAWDVLFTLVGAWRSRRPPVLLLRLNKAMVGCPGSGEGPWVGGGWVSHWMMHRSPPPRVWVVPPCTVGRGLGCYEGSAPVGRILPGSGRLPPAAQRLGFWGGAAGTGVPHLVPQSGAAPQPLLSDGCPRLSPAQS